MAVQFFVSLILLYKLIQQNYTSTQVRIDNIYLNKEINTLKQNNLYNYHVAGKKLYNDIILKDRKNNVTTLQDILSTHKFILVVPPLVCSSCFESMLEELPEIRKKLHDEIIILCSKDNLLQINAYVHEKGKSNIVYFANTSRLFPTIEMLPDNIPFFIKAINNEVKSLFIVSKSDIDYLNDYLKIESESY